MLTGVTDNVLTLYSNLQFSKTNNNSQSCIQHCIKAYYDLFLDNPIAVAKAPGRVNIIGEHIDHQDYPVLPAALEQSIQVTIGYGDETCILYICHENSNNYPLVVYKNINDIKIDKIHHQWTDYIVAAYFGAVEYILCDGNLDSVGTFFMPDMTLNERMTSKIQCILPRKGIRLFVNGNIPVASGVSSSSALVVAASLCLSHMFHVHMSRIDLASLCAKSERYVGTCGGGMDQAAVCLSRYNSASLIKFQPLSVETIALPKNDAATCYNKRVFELKLAAFIILIKEYPNDKIDHLIIRNLTLRRIQEKLNVSVMEALQIATKHISPMPYSRSDIQALIGEPYLNYILEITGGQVVWERNLYFELLRRVIHVYSEVQRVSDFVSICQNECLSEDEKLIKLGNILNKSDESLSIYFDCGTPELSEITLLARKYGAYGSRLIGAGWGGCTLSLVHKNNVSQFMEQVGTAYYKRTDRCIALSHGKNVSDAIFCVIPSTGAALYDNNGLQLEWI